MKIYIDRSPLSSGHAGRGIGTYTRLLIESLKKYSRVTIVNSMDLADVIHYPYFDLFFLTLPLIKSRPSIVTIHDVIPLLYRDAYHPGLRGTIKLLIQKISLSNCTHLVTDSDCSNNDICHYLNQPKEKVSTVYLAPNPLFKPASQARINEVKEKFNLNQPYLLYVGDINYNKNLANLIKSFTQFKDRSILVFISRTLRRSNPDASYLWNLIDQLGIEPRLRIINDIPNEDIETLKELYSGANWYIQPSIYEGFGLPVLEAQACECPVISTTGGSLKEILEDSNIVANENNLSEAIAKGLEMNLSERTKYIDNGRENVKRFSWQQAAQKMELIYEKI